MTKEQEFQRIIEAKIEETILDMLVESGIKPENILPHDSNKVLEEINDYLKTLRRCPSVNHNYEE